MSGKASVDSRVTESFVGLEEQLMAALRFAGRKLLGIETSEPGILAVGAHHAEVKVTIDGTRSATRYGVS